MDIRRVLLGWVGYVAVATTVYAVFFNGRFADGAPLPMWLVVTALVVAAAAVAILLRWLGCVSAGAVSEQTIRDYSGFLLIIVVTGVVGDLLAVLAEIAFGAAAVWLVIPISTITYCICVVWLHRRYFRPRPAVDARS